MKKLIICIDGLGYDLISRENTPFLYSFRKDNFLSMLQTYFAFTGIEYSFFSGKSPKEIGIWLEFSKSEKSIFNNPLLEFLSFNKKLRTYFGAAIQLWNNRTYIAGLHNIPRKKLKYFDSSAEGGLWKLPYFQNKNFAFYKWPFLITKDGEKEKSKIVFKYESDEERLRRLINEKNKDVYYTQLMSIDKTLHKFGKKSKEAKDALIKLDKIIEKYIKYFLKNNKDSEIIIWSDHGFADITQYINIEKILPKREDYLYFIAGTTVSFWFKNKEVKKDILEILSKIEGGEILDKKKADKFDIPLDSKNGEVIFYIKKGSYFFPNFYQKSEKEKFKAMHGYPDDKELNGFVLFSDKKVKKNLKIKNILGVLQ